MEPLNVEHVKTVCRNILLPDKPKRGLLWGFRLNAPDLMSVHDYRWPFPGNWATAPGPFTKTDDPCPPEVGDGICIAKTLGGAQSGGRCISSSSGLLLAYVQGDVLAESSHKLRVKRAWVAEIFDPVQAVVLSRADLSEADLSRANLYGADLSRANLSGANLTGANLSGANLSEADLSRADLYGAVLSRANLSEADLSGANLSRANLSGADLSRANLYGAYLSGADLSRANLYGAYLSGAYLSGANLYGADLSEAVLDRAAYNQLTLWPTDFDPAKAGAVRV